MLYSEFLTIIRDTITPDRYYICNILRAYKGGEMIQQYREEQQYIKKLNRTIQGVLTRYYNSKLNDGWSNITLSAVLVDFSKIGICDDTEIRKARAKARVKWMNKLIKNAQKREVIK